MKYIYLVAAVLLASCGPPPAMPAGATLTEPSPTPSPRSAIPVAAADERCRSLLRDDEIEATYRRIAPDMEVGMTGAVERGAELVCGWELKAREPPPDGLLRITIARGTPFPCEMMQPLPGPWARGCAATDGSQLQIWDGRHGVLIESPFGRPPPRVDEVLRPNTFLARLVVSRLR